MDLGNRRDFKNVRFDEQEILPPQDSQPKDVVLSAATAKSGDQTKLQL